MTADPTEADHRPPASTPSGWRVVVRDTVRSTMDEARTLVADGCELPMVLRAREQSGGRGRHGRPWRSPAGNLYVTVALRPDIPAPRAPELSLLSAVAIADTVTGFAGPVQLKWPNDVLLAGGKVAGILLEAIGQGGRLDALLLGIGINVASKPTLLDRDTACLSDHQPGITVDAVFERLVAEISRWEARWRQQGFGAVRAAWLARSLPTGSPMTVKLGDRIVAGRFAGLDDDGALQLAEADGSLRRVIAGEVIG